MTMTAKPQAAAVRASQAHQEEINFDVERPHFAWWVAIFGGMSLVSALACSERAYAAWAERAGGFLTRQHIFGIFVFAWALHIGESLYAHKVARDLGLSDEQRRGWTLQTFFLGYPSLGKLLRRRDAARAG